MRRRRAVALLFVLAVALASVAGTHARALERPPALQQQQGCELWHGRGSGNDDSMIDEVRICPEADGTFTGILQHSSTQSGFGIRTISGRIEHGTHYVFRDTAFVTSQPANGWRFCLSDGYTLDKTAPTHLEGTYDSEECDDHGHVSLDLVASGDGRTGMEGGTPPPPSPSPSQGPTPAPSPTPSPTPSPAPSPTPSPAPSPTPAPSPGRAMFGCD